MRRTPPNRNRPPRPRPPRKLERLQKILAQAGVASRRSAEKLIDRGPRAGERQSGDRAGHQGRRRARPHSRGWQSCCTGRSALRYFVLNKPKGFVTTVKDPEGRPTVMQFFEKMRERLYPVGRLDYLSEGLLLVTNDGELANRLTKAASGVEKTYLVKVAGSRPKTNWTCCAAALTIEQGQAPGEGRVRTSPARIRQVRQGTTPGTKWCLSRGATASCARCLKRLATLWRRFAALAMARWCWIKNRAICASWSRKSWLLLRLAADGKLRTPKAKELRRRNAMDAQLPTPPPRPTRPRPAMPFPPKQSVYRPTSPRSAPRPTSLRTTPCRSASAIIAQGHRSTGPRTPASRLGLAGPRAKVSNLPSTSATAAAQTVGQPAVLLAPTTARAAPAAAQPGLALLGLHGRRTIGSTRPSGRSPARPEWNKATGFRPKLCPQGGRAWLGSAPDGRAQKIRRQARMD